MNDNDIEAFPMYGVSSVVQYGMTLRDYFAAKAMAIILQESDWNSPICSDAGIAADAYKIADAMLAERAK